MMTTTPDRAPRRLRVSVFVKIIAVMLLMTVALIVMVGGFFAIILRPNLDISERLLTQWAQRVAAASPDRAQARPLGEAANIDIGYEGPDGAWTADAAMPALAQLRRRGDPGEGARWGRTIGDRDFYLVAAANGGTYLFSWDYRRELIDAHYVLLWLLVVVIAGIALIAYGFLRYLLRPLAWLDEGVAQVGRGDLTVVVPRRTRDEFGALTDSFNQMVRRVREMLGARDRLLLDVSHELRSPLTRLKVALALLPADESRARMEVDVAEMDAMIAELLELERLREGRGVVLARVDLLPILRDVVERVADRPPGVTLIALPPRLPLDLDEGKIRVVLRNLLENAIKYSSANSRPIEIAIEIATSVDSAARAATLRVTDDGPGIPVEDLANVFEPFFRVDPSRSKKTGGYGLGLSICKRIMEAHGGTIAVENAPGRGASFTLTFPIPPDVRT